MDLLPSELLEAIFTLSCTDGGRTGCSLASVSKHIRAAARTTRFHSVILQSGSALQLHRFLSLITAERAVDTPLKPRLKHLYVSSPKSDKDNFLRPFCRQYVGGQRPREVEDQAEEYSQERLAFVANLSLLLRTISAEVETLCLAQSGDGYRWTTEIPFPVPEAECEEFTELRELTVVGSGMTFSNAPTTAKIVYPRLTRLHLVTAPTRLGRWAERAPNISHLCVSDERGHMYHEVARVVHKTSESSLSFLFYYVRCSNADVSMGSGEAPVVFTGLKQFVVQPFSLAQPEADGQITFPWDMQGTQFNEWQLGWLTMNATQPFLLRPTKLFSSSETKGWEDVTLWEWLDRIDGGPGCWSAPP